MDPKLPARAINAKYDARLAALLATAARARARAANEGGQLAAIAAAAHAVSQPTRQVIAKLSIRQAPHIGIRVEGQGVFASGEVNAVNQHEFNDGDELVRIPTVVGGIKMPPDVGGYHLFHANHKDGATLQQWFDQGNITDPLSNRVIRQNQLERFTYRKPAPAGGKRYNKKRNTRKVIKKSNRRHTVRR